MHEIGIYTVFWNDVLEKVDSTNKLLQNLALDLNTAISAIKTKRDNFDHYEKQGVHISNNIFQYIVESDNVQ